MTRTSIFFALLAICLVAAPVFAQDGEGSTDLPASCIGEWAMDIDRLIAEDADMQAMDKEQRAAMEAMVRQMLGAATVTIDANSLTMSMMGEEQVSTIEVKSSEGNVYQLAVTNADGTVNDGTLTIVDANTLALESEGKKLWLTRKGAGSSETTPEAKSPKEVPLGEWSIDAERSMAKMPTEGMTDEEKAMMLKGMQQQAKILKITITADELKMEATIGDFSQSSTLEMVEVDESGDLDVVKIRVRREGDEEWSEGTITLHDEDLIEVDIDGEVFVLARRSEVEGPVVTLTGKHAELIGVWTNDVAASVKAAERNAGKTDEELKAEIEQATAMTAAMGLKFEFTAEAFIVHMGGNGIPQATYKVLGVEGNVLSVEMTTLDGEVRTGTITVDGDSAILDSGDGEPVHMKRAEKAGSDDGDDEEEEESGDEDGE